MLLAIPAVSCQVTVAPLNLLLFIEADAISYTCHELWGQSFSSCCVAFSTTNTASVTVDDITPDESAFPTNAGA